MKLTTLAKWYILTLLILPAVVFGGVSKDIAKQTIKEFNLEPRLVRSDHLLLPINYVEHEGRSYGYYLSRRFGRLAQQGDSFIIKKTRYEKRYVRLELESQRETQFALTIYDKGELTQTFLDNVLPMFLSDLFAFGEPPAGSRLVGNTSSSLVHIRGCNHLPRADMRIELATVEAAEADGYRRCPACFSDQPRIQIEGYAPLRALAVEETRLYELAFPPVDDPQAQADLQSLGESILEGFPVETVGFDYSFKLVHSELPQARGFYTGFVYITDKLMSMIEEPAELQFILAHEITHAELHSPLDPLFSFGTVDEVKSQTESYYQQLRDRETEADLMAYLYLTSQPQIVDPVHSARNALAKLQFVNEAIPDDHVDILSTHPSYTSRLALFEPDSFESCPTSQRVYRGLDQNGETLVELRVLGKGRGVDRMNFFLRVTTTDLLKEAIVRPEGRIKNGQGRYASFKGLNTIPLNTDTVIVVPVKWTGGKSGYGARRENRPQIMYDRFGLDDLQNAELNNVDGVEDWVVFEE